MAIADAYSPYERFMDPMVRDRLVGSLQRQFEKRVGSDEVEDAYGHMLEKLSKMAAADVEAIESPSDWLYIGMRNRLLDGLRLHSASNVHFGDLADANVLEDVLSDDDDAVAGAVLGREAAGERLAQVAELVWQKFTGTDGQIAARILLEEAKPQAVAAELGLDPAHVSTVAHKAHQERRLLERKVKENPEFRCWRLRKHMSAYYANGEASLALRAHWITCPTCRAAESVVRERTYAALAPFLPGAAVAVGVGGLFTRLLHHAVHPRRAARRLLRPAGHVGTKAGTSSTQLGAVGATVTSKVAVIATVAVVGTSAAGAATVVAVRHFTRQVAHRALVHTSPPRTAPTLTPAITTPAATHSRPSAQTSYKPQPSPKQAVKRREHVSRPKPKRRHVTAHAIRDIVSAPPAAAQTTPTAAPGPAPTPAPATTASSAPAATTAQPAPTTHTSSPASPSSSGTLSNPSYSTPNAP